MIAFAYAGKGLGDRWDEWQEKLHYADYVVLASIAVGVLYLLLAPAAPRRARRGALGRARRRQLRIDSDREHLMLGERLPLRHALTLGAIQGPTELLPVSSSGHLVLVPRLLDWPYAELDPELRKSFEVALHAGTAIALLIGLRREVVEYVRDFSGHNLVTLTLSFDPAAVIASLVRTADRAAPRRAGAGGAGAAQPARVAMALADGCPQERGAHETRPARRRS